MSVKEFERWDRDCDNISADKQKLLREMTAQLETKGESAQVLYRLAKVNMILSKAAEKENNKDLEKSLALDALSFASKACKADPGEKECHKWYCAACGKLANLSGNKEKIKYGHEFKEHADKALKIDPNDHFMQLMYGQWCYKVASLSWLERKLAGALYGAVPKADYDMALNAFKKADESEQDCKEVHLWMARTLMAKKENSEAKKWIEKGLSLQNKTVSDEIAHKELETMHKKCK